MMTSEHCPESQRLPLPYFVESTRDKDELEIQAQPSGQQRPDWTTRWQEAEDLSQEDGPPPVLSSCFAS